MIFALALHAPPRAPEALQARRDVRAVDAQQISAGRRRQGVVRIVLPHDVQMHMAVEFPVSDDVKIPPVRRVILAVDVVVLHEAKGEIVEPVQRPPGVGIIAVGDDMPPRRDKLRKAPERCLDIPQVLEKVEMIRLDVQNDRDGREKIQKRVAIFAALHNDRIALADPVPRVQQRQIAADHDGRVPLGLHEDMRDHGGRRCLAVGAGKTDGIAIRPHDNAPGLGPLKDGNARRPGRRNLRIVVMHRRRADNALGPADILRPVADENGDTAFDEIVRHDGRVHIRAGDLETHMPQHQPQRPHGNAADADQMHPGPGGEILLQRLFIRGSHEIASPK